MVRIGVSHHKALKKLAKKNSISLESLTALLIAEALKSKGKLKIQTEISLG
jgi:predicted HicB family RNase H-like nuclease